MVKRRVIRRVMVRRRVLVRMLWVVGDVVLFILTMDRFGRKGRWW